MIPASFREIKIYPLFWVQIGTFYKFTYIHTYGICQFWIVWYFLMDYIFLFKQYTYQFDVWKLISDIFYRTFLKKLRVRFEIISCWHLLNEIGIVLVCENKCRYNKIYLMLCLFMLISRYNILNSSLSLTLKKVEKLNNNLILDTTFHSQNVLYLPRYLWIIF